MYNLQLNQYTIIGKQKIVFAITWYFWKNSLVSTGADSGSRSSLSATV